ncbi:alpha-N-acetylgalactosaminide alpha-2,6-sialyltransferase 2-like, partial [Pteropus vampyrus]|uniref:alpha-N-acetylgalactosaminide alpha-2,6-sialyltransferase n=1 Tax=Pteropus vampyrus TaxID=132908 RepID=A0A6P6C5T3_PTEVA
SRPCQRPLYLAVQRHPHFQGLFDFSTPVLLSGGVFTQELWDHLSQHKAPYGWQGLSRQVSLLPRQDLYYIFIPSDIRDYVMLRSAILGVPVPEGPDKGDRPQTYFGPEASASKFKLLHPDFISYLTERFLKSKLMNTNFGNLYMPSTGALMLLTALHTCDQVRGLFSGIHSSRVRM